MKIVDLRSDTVTLPTEEMRKAIYNAELGDDVFGDDPTVNRLEKIAAGLVGMEASMLVSSGTQGNLVCLLTHCARGEEVIIGDLSHTFLNEAGGMSALGGIHPHTVHNEENGTMDLLNVEAAIRTENVHYPRTRLICIENTHNRCSGAPLSPEYTNSVVTLARKHGLKVHLDGARVFNAAVALGVDVKRLTEGVDSMIFCLSKGLSAPVGSIVCGSREFITEARRSRKILGGGMRQAGIIAAAGIIALEKMTERLREDHENARLLAQGMSKIQGLVIDPERIKTNIIYFDLVADRNTPQVLVAEMDRRGIRFLTTGPGRFRMVTHDGITRDDINMALKTLSEVMSRTV